MASLRRLLSGDQLEAALAPLQAKRQALLRQRPKGVPAGQSGGVSVEAEQVSVRGNVVGGDHFEAGGHVVVAESGATVVIGEAPVSMPAVERASALGRYLHHLISRNRYLQLQGIRSGGKLVHIELDQIYVTLRATRQRTAEVEEEWLQAEARLAPGEMGRLRDVGAGLRPAHTETVTVSVNEALSDHPRLVVLGDPGSGKTTLLRYLALLYARDQAENAHLVGDKLGLDESGKLPVLLPLRQIGAFLRACPDDGTQGCGLLLDFLLKSLANERIELPKDFFDECLVGGQAVILLDGLDEVADPDLRRRVSRLVESFTRAYPDCRYVVTSRIVGYTGPARLGEEYVTTTVRDFSLADVERFLSNWHRLIAVGQMGPGDSAEAYAAGQTRQLLDAIRANERIRELAINPLMLTVIALVHRDRVKLPDRRAELYAEAVDVLLGKWEEAKGLAEVAILDDKPFDTGDKRLMLQSLALEMHEGQRKEIEAAELRKWLGERFHEILGDWRAAERAVERFLNVIEERTGLLSARGEGVYAFSHLTFQEYLAAVAVAVRNDYVDYTLQRVPEPWWREVILLQAGYLSLQGKERTTSLVRAIAERKEEPEPYHNLVLAAECLRDVGGNRVQGDLENEVRRRLRADIEIDIKTEIERRRPKPGWEVLWRRLQGAEFKEKEVIQEIIQRKAVATQALVRAGAGYWALPYGEPEWIEIPAGEFWMGGEGQYDGKPIHRISLERFYIARVPTTNAQYLLFVQATGHEPPGHWEEGRPPKGKESHPVVNVSWYDAMAYCEWLSQVSGKHISLPSEAEWEKAARGGLPSPRVRSANDGRGAGGEGQKLAYPWGDTFDPTRCNSSELGLGDTTPVGIFLEGASPYGCLDMSGNVWEWTRSISKDYPYNPNDGRENIEAGDEVLRVLRGGSWFSNAVVARGSCRHGGRADYRGRDLGFRVLVSPARASRL
jgi:formylglycine-generating enzyme required for sulfatase activity/energy-coupling factor transporter ATP-binding protein EcfA2